MTQWESSHLQTSETHESETIPLSTSFDAEERRRPSSNDLSQHIRTLPKGLLHIPCWVYARTWLSNYLWRQTEDTADTADTAVKDTQPHCATCIPVCQRCRSMELLSRLVNSHNSFCSLQYFCLEIKMHDVFLLPLPHPKNMWLWVIVWVLQKIHYHSKYILFEKKINIKYVWSHNLLSLIRLPKSHFNHTLSVLIFNISYQGRRGVMKQEHT